jgi:Na+/H+ antiporter NhaD/arsenite permease-like protein
VTALVLTWTLGPWRPWRFAVGSLLLAYFVWDSRAYRQERPAALRRDRVEVTPLRLRGALNAAWLLAVVLAVALLRPPEREVAMAGLAALSLALTPRAIHRANAVAAGPILEGAVLFLGIFLTMPGFLGYLAYSGLVLLPLFAALTVLFLA